ncbi:hypothetical protein DL98DRAFT_553943 [Cadophora sp. DSE1049]|nr:hypothetical protein DL98DRAFT_553943 [Cadophora sp. DSE1049]
MFSRGRKASERSPKRVRTAFETSTYDLYLLISTKESSEFGIIKMQTNDTLILKDDSFIIKEQKEIAKAGFLIKPIQVFNPFESLTFNKCTIAINGDKNLERGLRYILIDFNLAKIYVFVNKSFANNKNLSLQIGFVLVIGSKTEGSTGFTFSNNIIYASFIKCKRVTRAVLASELQARLSKVFYYSLHRFFFFYKYIIKLGTTKEKCLIIDIIVIR